MRLSRADFFRKAGQALLITMALAASFHLAIATLTALYNHSLSYLNPLDFLGLSVVFPQYRNSRVAAGSGWLVLIALFGSILYISIQYHLYLSVNEENEMKRKPDRGHTVQQSGRKMSTKPKNTTRRQGNN